MLRVRMIGVLFVPGLLVAGSSLAQTAPPSPPSPPPVAAARPDAGKPPMPDTTKMTLLIQTNMVALSQAMLTGNYTVLHALGAPGFQQANSPQKLADTFAGLRAKNIDLTPIILFPPILQQQPIMDEHGMVHVTGFYNTQPQQVHFDMLFQPVAGIWRLFSISAGVAPAQAVSTQPNQQPPTPAPSAAAVKPPAKKKAAAPAKTNTDNAGGAKPQ